MSTADLLHALDSWFSQTKTIHFNEKQIRSSPASSSHVGQSSVDREELIAKKENLLFRDYRHDFPLRTFRFIDKIDSRLLRH